MQKQLQRKNGSFLVFLSVAVFTFLGLGACMNPLQKSAERSTDGSTGVRISIAAGEARTLLPAATFSKYVLHFSTSEGVTIPDDIPLTATNTGVISLEPANWTIMVTAYVNVEGVEVAAAEGQAQVSLAAGELKAVSIQVSSKLGGADGYFSYTVSYPGDVNYGYLNVYNSSGPVNGGPSPIGGGFSSEISKDLIFEPGDRIVLAPGYYGLRVELQTNYGMAVRTEIVHIYPGMETRGDYVFGEADFGSPITITGTVDLSGLGTVSYAAIGLFRDSDFTYLEGYTDAENPSDTWSWTVRTLPFNQPTDFYVELRIYFSDGGVTKRLPVPVSVYNQDIAAPDMGPFTVNRFNLSGVVDFSVLTSLGITNINYARVEVYQDGDTPSLFGSTNVNLGDGSWSFGILTEEASLPVRIVLRVQTTFGRTMYDEIQTNLTASQSELNFTPGPISAETTINGVGANNGDYGYLFVPDTSGAYAFNVSGAGSQETSLYLYDAWGNQLDYAGYGEPDAALSRRLTAGEAYYIRLSLNSSYRAFQFQVNLLPRTVTFNADGGTPATSAAQTPNGGTVSLPADPVKAGYTFGGWYTAVNGGGTAFTDTTPVTEDRTVYARWLVNAKLGSLSVSAGDLNPAFSADTTAYTVLVPSSTGSITVTAAVADPDMATLSPSSPYTVTLGTDSTVITLRVTAKDGTTTEDYTVTVNKAPAENAIGVYISIADERIDLTRSTENDLSQEMGNTLRLTAPGGYTNYAWLVDMGSSGYNSISETEIELNANWYWYSYGTHSVLLTYEKDGIPYGCEVLFKVVR